MKLNRLETHDRLLHLKKDQADNIGKGAEDCLKQNRDSLIMQKHMPYIYVFGHPRTADNGVDKRFLWQPRVWKPKAQTNSYLFRVESNTDLFQIIWKIPPRELWKQYQDGKVCEDPTVSWCIEQFENNRSALEDPEPNDLPLNEVARRYIVIREEIRHAIMQDKVAESEAKRIKEIYDLG